ncbi:hypothetical protein BGZ76_005002, partial [Entomortierella beljakovae]
MFRSGGNLEPKEEIQVITRQTAALSIQNSQPKEKTNTTVHHIHRCIDMESTANRR